MFGLPSIQKLIVLGLAIAVVWYGFKFLGRLQQQRKTEAKLREAEARGGKKVSEPPPASAGDTVADLVPCPSCGAYIQAGTKCSCGRQN
ncbi:hypothetical protein [Pelagibius sp.]|uniref:hypothetical protein n=1 Tax=Pelagibius sp. TaxID=1931238 RepID=UPI00261F54C5|nr:hypothetical protein [Pelagibius sp.]